MDEMVEADEYVVTGKQVGKTATKMNVPLYQVPATVQVISGETLKEQGVNEWTEALYNVPGVFTVHQGAGFVGASARGQSANSTLVLFDGVRDDTTQFATTGPFPSLEDMERIEYLKGPASVVYGQGAIGGAINFIRNKPSRKESYELNVKMGQYETWRSHFGAQGALPLGAAYRLDGAISRNGTFRDTSSRMSKITLSLDQPLWSGASALFIGTMNKDEFDNGQSVPTNAGAVGRPGAPRHRRYHTPDAILY
jgi:outer membrane receptor protein involved in Fe transport